MRDMQNRRNEALVNVNDQLQITKVGDRTQILFKKAILKGKVTQTDVMNTILIASRMQAEMYVNKLSRGIALDSAEVKSLKELSEIIKVKIDSSIEEATMIELKPETEMQDLKATIYDAIVNRSRRVTD